MDAKTNGVNGERKEWRDVTSARFLLDAVARRMGNDPHRARMHRESLAREQATRANGTPLDNLLSRIDKLTLDVELKDLTRAQVLERLTHLRLAFESDCDDEARGEEAERAERDGEVMF